MDDKKKNHSKKYWDTMMEVPEGIHHACRIALDRKSIIFPLYLFGWCWKIKKCQSYLLSLVI